MKNVDIPELGAIAHGDLALYPTAKTMTFLRQRDADKGYATVAERKERILADGLALAEQCADMWVKLRDLKDGEGCEVSPGEEADFDCVMGIFHSFRVLTPLERPWESDCPSMYQCWSCPDGVKSGVCKHALVHSVHMNPSVWPKERNKLTALRKRGKGAPKKTKAALECHLDEFLPSLEAIADVVPTLGKLQSDSLTAPAAPTRRSARTALPPPIVDV